MSASVATISYGPDGLPERTLGWEALDWCSSHLQDLDGRPWVFTDEQARFVAHWYALTESGRWQWQRGVLRRMKGWGKDPLVAALAVFELLGPCRFGGWYSDGEPFGVPESSAWIQVAGATAGQAEQNTMSLFGNMVPEWLRVEEQLSIGLQIVWASGKRRIQSVSNASRGVEGARPSLVIMGETQHWVSANGGKKLAAVLRRNVIKSPQGKSRTLAITNAHMDGEDSVAEDDWKSRNDEGMLYDSREAPQGLNETDLDDVKLGILAARGDSTWLDVDSVAGTFFETEADIAECKRFFWNKVIAGGGRWMEPSAWAAAEVDRKPPTDKRVITLGFDGSLNRDATALVGTDIETGWQWVVGLWEKNHNNTEWEVPKSEVLQVVAEARQRWTVARFYADPRWFEETVASWQAEFTRKDGKPVVVAWYTGQQGIVRTARAVGAYQTSIESGACTHEKSDAFTRHVVAAHTRLLPGRAGEDGLCTISKSSRSSTDCIDIAFAGILSWQACLDARGDGDLDLLKSVPLEIALPSWL